MKIHVEYKINGQKKEQEKRSICVDSKDRSVKMRSVRREANILLFF